MIWENTYQIIKDTGKNWVRHKAPLLSAALAFFAMLSLSPVLLVATSVAGLIYEDEAAHQKLLEQVESISDPEVAAVVDKALANARFSLEGSIWAATASVVLLLFSASIVFVQFKSSLNTIWQVKPGDRKRSAVRRFVLVRGLSIVMVLVLGVLFLLSLIVSAMLVGLNDYIASFGHGFKMMVKLTHTVLSLGLMGLLFSVVFRMLPDTKVDARASWIGGFFTVFLLSVGKWGIGLYLGGSAVGSAYGAAGSLIVFMLWIYYTMMVVFLGAEFTHTLSTRYLEKHDEKENWFKRLMP